VPFTSVQNTDKRQIKNRHY